jgi:hypothetical protein
MAEKSLKMAIERWLAPRQEMVIRVARFGRIRPTGGRFVVVEVSRPEGVLSITFFRHDDCLWRVFPPQAARPAIGISITNVPIGGEAPDISHAVSALHPHA